MKSAILYTTAYSKRKNSRFFLKRGFDFCFSFLLLVFLSPLFLLIGLAIYLSSPGKIIYAQERLGKGGKPFKCYKFRTMHLDAEQRLEELLVKDTKLLKEWKLYQKLKRDPRTFSFGRFLRKTSLDELPQFFNALKGELSVVGPRPYMVSQLQEMGSFQKKILSVKPGITGIWQTSGRSRTSFQARLNLDAKYVEKSSFWLDILLILKTLPVIFFAKDAC